MNTIPIRLNQQTSRALLDALEKQEHPWMLLYAGKGVFRVVVADTETAHELDLSATDGTWCMHTAVEI